MGVKTIKYFQKIEIHFLYLVYDILNITYNIC